MSNGGEQGNTSWITLTSPESGLEDVHLQLEKVWEQAPYVEFIDRLSFETALIELVSNIFQHEDSGISPACTLTIQTFPDRIECNLVDSGVPKNVQLTGRKMPEESAESGRGILLIQALVSELCYTRDGDYNRWTIIKKILPTGSDFSPVPQLSLVRPINEKARQHALESLNILDTAPEERLDLITRMTQKLFGVETCTISLIDDDRQWFKSRIGLDVEETPRDQAFCDYTIRQYETMVVPDAHLDSRFQANPLVTGPPKIRFYAGFPIEVGDGQPIGTLCIFDPNPRILTEPEKALLRDLAMIAQNELAGSRDLAQAREVQNGLLPTTLPHMPGYEIAGICLPSQAVGGDFYDWYEVENGVSFTLADVMGKGTGAAIIAATVRAALRTTSQQSDITKVIASAAKTFDADLEASGKFVTLFHAQLHTDTGKLEYVDAGHGLSWIFRANGELDYLSSGNLPLGLNLGEPWIVKSTILGVGDTLVSISDGVLDLVTGLRAGLEQAASIVARSSTAQAVVDALQQIAESRSAPDDVTILVLRRSK
jgi:anti-sigma regulatory factor (Ser/Thr protein kinase)